MPCANDEFARQSKKGSRIMSCLNHPRLVAAFLLACAGLLPLARGQDYEQEPIRYSQTEPDNRVSRLLAELESGAKSLDYEEGRGYLRSLLAALEVPVSSQTLVFS